MVRNTNWIRIGVLSVVLMGTVVTGCTNQNSNPDNISGAPLTAANKTTTVSQMNTADTWSRIEEARAELDIAIKAKNLDQVHAVCVKIRDMVKSLPDKSLMLPEDKRKTLVAHVNIVEELVAKMDRSNDPNDMKSTQEDQTAMNDTLDMIKGIYPTEAMQTTLATPDMNSPGNNMPDDKTGMGDKMSGMGNSTDPGTGSGRSTDPGTKPDRDMMDKMTSGLSAMDKDEMKRVLDEMMAMPPAERKQAMQKMSGMGNPPDPGKQADANNMPMPSGGMGGHM